MNPELIAAKIQRLRTLEELSDAAITGRKSSDPVFWRALMRSWAISARLRMLFGCDNRIRGVVRAHEQACACRDRALALENARQYLP